MSSSTFHGFCVETAQKYGVEEAILIHHFQFWIKFNRRQKNKKHFKENQWWTFQTRADIAAHFPYWRQEEVRRLIERLVFLKVLKIGHFNKCHFDRTCWYAFDNEELFLGNDEENSNNSYERQNCHIPEASQHMAKLPNQKWQNCQIRNGKIATPIPDTKQDTEKDKRERASSLPPRFQIEKENGEKKVQRAENVFTTDEEHRKLEEQLGLEVRDKCYKILSLWKLDTPKGKWKKNDYRSILRWVVDAVKEKEKKGRGVEGVIVDKLIAEGLCSRLNVPAKIEARDSYICFRGIGNAPDLIINYGEIGFREKLEGRLRKMGYQPSDWNG